MRDLGERWIPVTFQLRSLVNDLAALPTPHRALATAREINDAYQRLELCFFANLMTRQMFADHAATLAPPALPPRHTVRHLHELALASLAGMAAPDGCACWFGAVDPACAQRRGHAPVAVPWDRILASVTAGPIPIIDEDLASEFDVLLEDPEASLEAVLDALVQTLVDDWPADLAPDPHVWVHVAEPFGGELVPVVARLVCSRAAQHDAWTDQERDVLNAFAVTPYELQRPLQLAPGHPWALLADLANDLEMSPDAPFRALAVLAGVVDWRIRTAPMMP